MDAPPSLFVRLSASPAAGKLVALSVSFVARLKCLPVGPPAASSFFVKLSASLVDDKPAAPRECVFWPAQSSSSALYETLEARAA